MGSTARPGSASEHCSGERGGFAGVGDSKDTGGHTTLGIDELGGGMLRPPILSKLLASLWTESRLGCSMRHGPHHDARKYLDYDSSVTPAEAPRPTAARGVSHRQPAASRLPAAGTRPDASRGCGRTRVRTRRQSGQGSGKAGEVTHRRAPARPISAPSLHKWSLRKAADRQVPLDAIAQPQRRDPEHFKTLRLRACWIASNARRGLCCTTSSCVRPRSRRLNR